MKTKNKTIDGRNFTLYEDGRVYSHPFTDRLGRKRDGRFLKQGLSGHGYLATGTGINGKRFNFRAHRVVAEVCLGDFDESLQVDHIDGDKLNNAPENLRMLTNSENHRSFKNKKKGTSSKYRGVARHKATKKWAAQIHTDGTKKHLGYFDDEEEAALAYDQAAEERGFNKEALNSTYHPELSMSLAC